MESAEVNLVYLIPIVIGVLASTVAVIKHFWARSKCLYLIQQKVEKLETDISDIKTDIEKEIETSRNVHIEIFKKLNEIDTSHSELKGMMKMLVDKK